MRLLELFCNEFRFQFFLRVVTFTSGSFVHQFFEKLNVWKITYLSSDNIDNVKWKGDRDTVVKNVLITSRSWMLKQVSIDHKNYHWHSQRIRTPVWAGTCLGTCAKNVEKMGDLGGEVGSKRECVKILLVSAFYSENVDDPLIRNPGFATENDSPVIINHIPSRWRAPKLGVRWAKVSPLKSASFSSGRSSSVTWAIV